jgi:4-carboxy-3-alkylbut-2-enoyl-[acp] decarboxylase
MGLIDVVDRGPVRWIRMQDTASDNALTAPMVAALESALRVDRKTRVVVLAGLAEVFSSGASPAVLEALETGEIAPTELTLPRAVLATPVPVIAAMRGHAIGGGLALGLCADVVLFAEDRRYGATFMNHGFTPGMGSTRLLERVMRPALAHELLLGGEPMRGDALARAGVANVWPGPDVEARGEEIALRIADKPRDALCLLKEELATPWRGAFERAHSAEARMHRVCFDAARMEARHA